MTSIRKSILLFRGHLHLENRLKRLKQERRVHQFQNEFLPGRINSIASSAKGLLIRHRRPHQARSDALMTSEDLETRTQNLMQTLLILMMALTAWNHHNRRLLCS